MRVLKTGLVLLACLTFAPSPVRAAVQITSPDTTTELKVNNPINIENDDLESGDTMIGIGSFTVAPNINGGGRGSGRSKLKWKPGGN